MTPGESDTICAIATAPGKSGVGIIRVSGPATQYIAKHVLGDVPVPRTASLFRFHDENGEVIDRGIALFFKSPASFTGEDVLELQGHGGKIILDLLLRSILNRGARLASPGEFSERAFINGKLDLAQLEGIADLIDASTEQAARSAFRTLDGKFSRLIHELVEELTALRAYVEAGIDFAEEEIDFLSNGSIAEKLASLTKNLDLVLLQARQGALLKEGIHVVIAGQPNTGKSSLLNCLSGKDSAIVTNIPGTTRDTLNETINLDGLPVHITDTAGLRDSQDQVEQEGMLRARRAMSQADIILLIIDAVINPVTLVSIRDQLSCLDLEGVREVLKKIIIVFNKIDLCTSIAAGLHRLEDGTDSFDCVAISCHTAAGLESLKEYLKDKAGYQLSTEGNFAARQRHLDALRRCKTGLEAALKTLAGGSALELVAEELRLSQRALGEITGQVSTDDLLGRIFASFCVGK